MQKPTNADDDDDDDDNGGDDKQIVPNVVTMYGSDENDVSQDGPQNLLHHESERFPGGLRSWDPPPPYSPHAPAWGIQRFIKIRGRYTPIDFPNSLYLTAVLSPLYMCIYIYIYIRIDIIYRDIYIYIFIYLFMYIDLQRYTCISLSLSPTLGRLNMLSPSSQTPLPPAPVGLGAGPRRAGGGGGGGATGMLPLSL